MELRKSISGSTCQIAVTGKFTFSDHSTFKTVIEAAKDGAITGLTLDLSGLDFIDSAALGMLLISREEANKRGFKITIHKPQGHVLKMFKLSKFDTLFNIVE
jgi:HptB-dependent secretion and biofilm anti anti-sigma factor